MNTAIAYGQCVAFALVSGFSGIARAQEPGTNVPTQPSMETPITLQPATSPSDLGSPAPVVIAPPDEPVIDADSTRRTYPNRPLLVTGLVVLAASYGAGALVGALTDRPADDKLYYPVVGPWLDLRHRGCAADPCSNNRLDRVLIGGDGVLQAIGAAGVLLSLVVPEKTTRQWYLIGNEQVLVAPQFSASSLGLGVVGEF